MKLKTSFFNPTVLRKDITRFAPIWILYSIFASLVVLLLGSTEPDGARFACDIPEILYGMAALNLFYGPLVAFLLFGDLFQTRLCNALHAMPMRREGWFLTHLTAGLFFGIVPNLIPCLLACLTLGSYSYVAFLWLAVVLLQYLFFFGAGCFAVHCAGNRIGALAIYCILNFLSILVAWIGATFYIPLLYGIELDFAVFAEYSPVVGLTREYMQVSFDNMTDTAVFGGFVAETWRYLWIAAGSGVLLLVASLLIYRKRHLETAGDMISFSPASPVFLVIYTLCAGAVLYLMGSLGDKTMQYVFLFIGLAIGFFTGKMLLEKRVRVFHKKNLLFFLLFAVAFALSLGVTALDPVGITRYVPEAEEVQSVKVAMSHYYYDINNDSITLESTEAIEDILQVQQLCIGNRYAQDALDGNAYPITIQYQLKDGRTISRKYYVNPADEEGKLLEPHFSTMEAIFGAEGAETLKNLRSMEVYSYEENIPVLVLSANSDYLNLDWYKDEYKNDSRVHAYYVDKEALNQDPYLQGLIEAIRKDCEEGNMAQSWGFQQQKSQLYSVNIQLMYNMGGYTQRDYVDLIIFESAKHTVAYLNSLMEAPYAVSPVNP